MVMGWFVIKKVWIYACEAEFFSKILALATAASEISLPLNICAISSTRSCGVSICMWLTVPCGVSSLLTFWY